MGVSSSRLFWIALSVSISSYLQLAAFTQSSPAHHEAATLPAIPVLHRDISGGNILILPRVSKDSNVIEWSGLLTDWEMSKPIDDQSTPSRMSKGRRMVRCRLSNISH